MTIDENPKALGTLTIGVPKQFKYIFTTDEFPVVITKVTTGCGSCTHASAERNYITPNTEMTLNVTFTPKTIGAQTKTITVSYTENDVPATVVLTFTSTVIK